MFKLPVKFIYMRREAALTLLNTSFYLSLSSKLGPAPILGHLDGTAWMSLVLVCSCLCFLALGLTC